MRAILAINLLYAGSQLFLTIFLSREYGPQTLAIYGVITGCMGPVLAFVGAGQRLDILGEGDSSYFRTHIYLRGLLVGGSGVGALAYLFLTNNLSSIDLIFATVAVLFRILDSHLEITSWQFLSIGDIKKYLFLGQLRFSPVFVFGILAVIFKFTATQFFITCSFLIIVALLIRDPKIATVERSDVRGISAFSIFRRISPSGAGALCESATVIYPRFFLSFGGADHLVAAYMVAMQLVAGFGLVASSVSQRDLLALRSSGSKQIFHAVKRSLALFVLLYIALLCVLYFMPVSVFNFVFGDWISDYRFYLIYSPLITLWMFGVGYLANLAGAKFGHKILAFSSAAGLLTLLTLLTFIFGPSSLGRLDLIAISLCFAILIKLLVVGFFVLKQLKSCQNVCF